MTRPDITTADRLAMTVIFALLMHAAVVLGVGFENKPTKTDEEMLALDVILVQRKTQSAPEDADYLAQAAQRGGGSSVEKVRPKAPMSTPVPRPEPGRHTQVSEATAPIPVERTQTPVVTQRQSNTPRLKVDPSKARPREPLPQSDRRTERARQIARLEAEIGKNLEAYAKRPRRKFISANTREFEYASYMHSWVARVERAGNVNYPEEARRRSLEGSLVLTVGIGRDGRIADINVVESSGHLILDEAAIQIVQLAGPYEPLPDDVRDEVDVLYITRTWQFLPGATFAGE